MKKNILKLFFIIVAIFGVTIFLLIKQPRADNNKFSGVIPFTTVGGLMGFFNQNDGKLYIYDTTLQNCLLASQIEELGKPLTQITGYKE